MLVVRLRRMDSLSRSVQTELGKRRCFELVVREDLHVRGMIDGNELDLIDVGDLVQFLGDADRIGPRTDRERTGGNLNVLVMVHLKKAAVAGACTERRDAEHVGDEAERLTVPCED